MNFDYFAKQLKYFKFNYKMSKSNGIQVYLRVKPTKKPDSQIKFEPEEGKIEFTFTKDGLKHLETRQEFYGFQFNGILDMLTRQETVFD